MSTATGSSGALAMRIVRLLLLAGAICSFGNAAADSRGVRPHAANDGVAVEAFDPAQSAALFVGVRRFPYDPTLAEVRYAVDDAVDLACLLALHEPVRLVDPSHVVLALSGEPQKPDSQRNLERLVAAGARVRSGGGPDILNALDEQSRAAGSKGLLILAFATHGFTTDGAQYLLTATSILRHREGAIAESEIRDIAAQSDAARSLIFVDACRERLTDGQRSGRPDSRSAAALLQAMDGVHGQVVLSAAAAGQYAYDDDDRHNGVFTAALIDGLRCQASADERGLITVDSLSSFVEQHVLTWIRKHRNPRITHATQASFDGSAKTMPLAQCRNEAATAVAVVPNETPPKTATPLSLADSASADPKRGITVVALDDSGEPVPQLLAAATDAVRESGYDPVSLPRSAALSRAALQQLASGRADFLKTLHLPKVCRAMFAGTVVRSTTAEKDASLEGMIATHLNLRFYLLDSGSGAVLSAVIFEARGGGFSKESSERQAWERATATLRLEMRKLKWTELLAVR